MNGPHAPGMVGRQIPVHCQQGERHNQQPVREPHGRRHDINGQACRPCRRTVRRDRWWTTQGVRACRIDPQEDWP